MKKRKNNQNVMKNPSNVKGIKIFYERSPTLLSNKQKNVHAKRQWK